jgi:hypothetical protein
LGDGDGTGVDFNAVELFGADAVALKFEESVATELF